MKLKVPAVGQLPNALQALHVPRHTVWGSYDSAPGQQKKGGADSGSNADQNGDLHGGALDPVSDVALQRLLNVQAAVGP